MTLNPLPTLTIWSLYLWEGENLVVNMIETNFILFSSEVYSSIMLQMRTAQL